MFVSLLVSALLAAAANANDPILLGPLKTRAHALAGEVSLLSESVIEIKVRRKYDTEYEFNRVVRNIMSSNVGLGARLNSSIANHLYSLFSYQNFVYDG